MMAADRGDSLKKKIPEKSDSKIRA